MKPLFHLLGGLLLALTLNSCATDISDGVDKADNPQPCQAGPQPFSSLEKENGCTGTQNLLLDGTAATAQTIIRTQADFNQRVSGNCHPQVDFARYDLVIGQQVLGGAASSSATYAYQRNCAENERVLQVTLKMGVTRDFGIKSYHVLVPKLAVSETVKVEVQVLDSL